MTINSVEFKCVEERNGVETFKNDTTTYYMSGSIICKDLNKLMNLKKLGMGAPLFDMKQRGEIIDCKEFGISELI